MMIYVTQTHNDYIKLHNCSDRTRFCFRFSIQILFYHRNIFFLSFSECCHIITFKGRTRERAWRDDEGKAMSNRVGN